MAKATNKAENQTTALTAPATGAVAGFDLAAMQVKARLILPSISIKNMNEGDSLFFKAQGEISYKEQVDEDTGEIKLEKKGPRKGQPALLPILAVSTPDGQMGQLVLPAIAHSAMLEAAKLGALSGRIFGMRKGKSKGTGKATEWEVVEMGA